MKLVIATANKGKVREITAALEGLGVELLCLENFSGFKMPPETGSTFKENALIKARAVSEFTGLSALADDSGLEVDFLNGAPGIHSARYAAKSKTANASDEENIERLLSNLKGVPSKDRSAHFTSVIALVLPFNDLKEELTFDGFLNGRITERRVGAGGFGYDPVFFIPNLGVTAAELSVEEKGEVSHRGGALKGLKEWLRSSGLL